MRKFKSDSSIAIAGAGLVGSLWSIFLAKRGFEVDLYERRPDMREESILAGRSINLAVSTRGLHALKQVGLEEEVLKQAIPMRGRMIHAVNGETSLQAYGLNSSECIHSISRGGLNKTLMTAAERTGRVSIHFESKVDGLETDADVLFGCDGATSAVRAEMVRQTGYQCTESHLNYGYKELTIPPTRGGGFAMEKNALHIWPRGTFMLIALPNFDGSFTCTLFLPFKGEVSLAALSTPAKTEAFFKAQFADTLELIPDLAETFSANPTGHMVTVKCVPWNRGERALLLGDAAHAIVPFFGQGMNCGFEDCTVLDELIGRYSQGTAVDWSGVFEEFSRIRKPNTDAIADMAVENFTEMRDKVADPKFVRAKSVEKILEKEFAEAYWSRYRLVTFSRVPYRTALKVGKVEDEILNELCQGLDSPKDVDLIKARALIDRKLAPLLKR